MSVQCDIGIVYWGPNELSGVNHCILSIFVISIMVSVAIQDTLTNHDEMLFMAHSCYNYHTSHVKNYYNFMYMCLKLPISC